MTGLLTGAEFEERFWDFRYSVFRLETLQLYRGSGEDAAITAFQTGREAPPQDPAQTDWEEQIRRNRALGRLMQRVHIVVEPVSEYMSFELTWAYGPNVAAGEDVRIIPTGGATWPEDLPRHDFWLFDSSRLFDAHYDPDGTWLGVEQVLDPARIVAACRWRDAALHTARPWRDYMSADPALAARIPTA